MPVTPTYPGVYVQEVPSGVRTIAGVSTSIAMFIGAAKKGPMFQPVRCTNYTEFVRAFSADTSVGQLPNYVKLFFLNGGTDCYVMRILKSAAQASVTLKSETDQEVLKLTAKDAGLMGENIRAVVTYAGEQPEVTFNLDLFRWEEDAFGKRSKKDLESHSNLTMDPHSTRYAPDVISGGHLVLASAVGTDPPNRKGFSLSGRAIAATDLLPTWHDLLTTKARTRFKISVGGFFDIEIDLALGTPVRTDDATNLASDIKGKIKDALSALDPAPSVAVSFPQDPNGFHRMQIEPALPTTGDVFISAVTNSSDLAKPMMLGTAQGGIEVSWRAMRRPAPNGITFKGYDPAALNTFAVLDQTQLERITLDALQSDGTSFAPLDISMTAPDPPPSIVTVNTIGATMMQDNFAVSDTGHSDGVREKFTIIAQRINAAVLLSGGSLKWKADVWGSRLAILPTDVDDNFVSMAFATSPASLTGQFSKNVNLYGVGTKGTEGQQTAGTAGVDGTPPDAADYGDAYNVIDKEVDLFNLMVLPPPAAVPVQDLYGNASVFCQQRRAFLLMDPPSSWISAQEATKSANLIALRAGLVKDFSAVFFPNLTIVDDNGFKKNIGPAGAIAGLCARTDGTRGVWKAPAGTDADLRGVIGLEQKFSDGENGILNPRAINTIRIFPNGIVNWGARTMDGDDGFASEYKYIPIRRLALYMEESLYRGLKWVVFEPNDEPLWAQIRLNVGAFMHNLFRQGAFQGTTPKDAYFVKCDKETTTQNDRNLGIVNIWVGFAPLKPAEFVILYLQQMAGQIQV